MTNSRNTDRHFRDLIQALNEQNNGIAASLAGRLIAMHRLGEPMPRWPDGGPSRTHPRAFLLGRLSMAVDLNARDIYDTTIRAIETQCRAECRGARL